MQTSVGDLVGYHIGQSHPVVSSNTRILFCTTGVLLHRLISAADVSSKNNINNMLDHHSNDNFLKNENVVIIIDEVHERDLNTDLILALIKIKLTSDKQTKVVLMSATMDARIFAAFLSPFQINQTSKRLKIEQNRLMKIVRLVQERNVLSSNPILHENEISKLNIAIENAIGSLRASGSSHDPSILSTWDSISSSHPTNNNNFTRNNQARHRHNFKVNQNIVSPLLSIPPPQLMASLSHAMHDQQLRFANAWDSPQPQFLDEVLASHDDLSSQVPWDESLQLQSECGDPQLLPLLEVSGRRFDVGVFYIEHILEIVLNAPKVIFSSQQHQDSVFRPLMDSSYYIDDKLGSMAGLIRGNAPLHMLTVDGISQTLNNAFIAEMFSSSVTLSPSLYIPIALLIECLFCNAYNHNTLNNATLLMFLPGIAEIDAMKSTLLETLPYIFKFNENPRVRDGMPANPLDRFQVIRVHSSTESDEGNLIFSPCPFIPGSQIPKMKILLATNIAESSITIPTVSFVVDFCLSRELKSSSVSSELALCYASKANLTQRLGRAGRTHPGLCFRVIPTAFLPLLSTYSTPEILKTPLDRVVLLAKLFSHNHCPGVYNNNNNTLSPSEIATQLGLEPITFLRETPQPPPISKLQASTRVLVAAGALNSDTQFGTTGDLTRLGQIFASLPLDVIASRILMFAFAFGLSEEGMLLAALNNGESRRLFLFPGQFASPEWIDSYRCRLRWSFDTDSDLLSDLFVLQAYLEILETHGKNRAEDFARANYLSHRTLRDVLATLKDLQEKRQNIDGRCGVSYSISSFALHHSDFIKKDTEHNSQTNISSSTTENKFRPLNKYAVSDRVFLLKVVLFLSNFPNVCTTTPTDRTGAERLRSSLSLGSHWGSTNAPWNRQSAIADEGGALTVGKVSSDVRQNLLRFQDSVVGSQDELKSFMDSLNAYLGSSSQFRSFDLFNSQGVSELSSRSNHYHHNNKNKNNYNRRSQNVKNSHDKDIETDSPVTSAICEIKDVSVGEKFDSILVQFSSSCDLKIAINKLIKTSASSFPGLFATFNNQRARIKLSIPLAHSLRTISTKQLVHTEPDSVLSLVSANSVFTCEVPALSYSRLVNMGGTSNASACGKLTVRGVTLLPHIRGLVDVLSLLAITNGSIEWDTRASCVHSYTQMGVFRVFHKIRAHISACEIGLINNARQLLNDFFLRPGHDNRHLKSTYNCDLLCDSVLRLTSQILPERQNLDNLMAENLNINDSSILNLQKIEFGISSMFEPILVPQPSEKDVENFNHRVNDFQTSELTQTSIVSGAEDLSNRRGKRADAQMRIISEIEMNSYLLSSFGDRPSLVCNEGAGDDRCWRRLVNIERVITNNNIDDNSNFKHSADVVMRKEVEDHANGYFTVDHFSPLPRSNRSEAINHLASNLSSCLPTTVPLSHCLEIRQQYASFNFAPIDSSYPLTSSTFRAQLPLSANPAAIEKCAQLSFNSDFTCRYMPILMDARHVLQQINPEAKFAWILCRAPSINESSLQSCTPHAVGFAVILPGAIGGEPLNALCLVPPDAPLAAALSGELLWSHFTGKYRSCINNLNTQGAIPFVDFSEVIVPLHECMDDITPQEFSIDANSVKGFDLEALGLIPFGSANSYETNKSSQQTTRGMKVYRCALSKTIWKRQLIFFTKQPIRTYHCKVCQVEFTDTAPQAVGRRRGVTAAKSRGTTSRIAAVKHFTKNEDHRSQMRNFNALDDEIWESTGLIKKEKKRGFNDHITKLTLEESAWLALADNTNE